MAAYLIWKALKTTDGVYREFNEFWKELPIQRIVIPRVNTRQAVVLWALKLAGYWSVIRI